MLSAANRVSATGGFDGGMGRIFGLPLVIYTLAGVAMLVVAVPAREGTGVGVREALAGEGKLLRCGSLGSGGSWSSACGVAKDSSRGTKRRMRGSKGKHPETKRQRMQTSKRPGKEAILANITSYGTVGSAEFAEHYHARRLRKGAEERGSRAGTHWCGLDGEHPRNAQTQNGQSKKPFDGRGRATQSTQCFQSTCDNPSVVLSLEDFLSQADGSDTISNDRLPFVDVRIVVTSVEDGVGNTVPPPADTYYMAARMEQAYANSRMKFHFSHYTLPTRYADPLVASTAAALYDCPRKLLCWL